MTLVRNPFDAGGYSLAEMTQAINILPNLYTRLGQIGLFRFEGVTQRSVIIEQYEGVLNLLPSVPLGGPATVGTREGRSMRSFALPWIPHDDVILPGDIQGQPALGVFDLPFLFSDAAEAEAVLDGEFGAFMSEKLEASGLVNLAWWENGFRNLTNSVRPVTSLEDFQGMRVRVMQNNIFLDTFQTLGANATPMAFGEVFTALETKAIDAQENPYVTIDTSQFYEVQDYLSATQHAYTPFMVLFSKPVFDSYSAEEQQILRDCAVEGRDEQRRVSRELSEVSLSRVQEEGMAFNELDLAELERIREAVAGVYDRHAGTIGQDVIDRMMAELETIRAE